MKYWRRLLAIGVVGLTAIAACVGAEHFSTTQQSSVVISPTTINFPNTQLGSTAMQSFTVSPASGSGSSNDIIDSITFSCADFFVGSGSGLPIEVFRRCATVGSAKRRVGTEPTQPDRDDPAGAGPGTAMEICQDDDIQTATFPVTFQPKSAGSQSCQVQVKGTFGQINVTLNGTGVLSPFVISATPTDLDFGDVRQATTSRVVKIIVANEGGMPLTISSVTGFGGPFSVAGNTGNHSIPVGGQDVLDVTCTPPSVGTVSANLTINSNATNKPALVIPLKCNGIDTLLSTNPGSPIDLDTRVGQPLTRTVTITNTGAAQSILNVVSIVDTTEVTILNPPAPDHVLAPLGGNVSVDIRYPADTEQAKTTIGKLRIAHDGNKQDDVSISVEAVPTSLGANPDGAEFGPVCVGSMKSMPLQLFATNAGAFQVMSFTTPAAPFTFTGSPGLAEGNHGNNLEFTAAVTPAIEGLQSTTVTVTTDIPGAPTRDFALSVEGLPDGVSAFPPAVDYGTVDIGGSTLFKSVKLTNCSTGPLTVTGAAIEGDAADDFEFVGVAGNLPLERTLEPTETEEFLIIMSPKLLPGNRTANFVVTHSDGKTTARLDGTAIGELPEDTKGPETYYECSAGGSGGAFVGLAILGLLIRRRRR